MSIEIENNIPIPGSRTHSKNGSIISTLRLLEVGQSVFLEGKRTYEASGYIFAARRNNSKKFITRTINGGCRVWRIE